MSEARRRAALRRGAATRVNLLELDHPLGVGRFWSGTGNFDLDGATWYGWGVLGAISETVSSTEIEIVETRFTLSGVDEDLVAGLDQPIKGRAAYLYEAFLDDSYRLIHRDRFPAIVLDARDVRIGADLKATIVFTGHSGWASLRNRSGAKVGPEEGRAAFADETGWDDIHRVEDQQDRWTAS